VWKWYYMFQWMLGKMSIVLAFSIFITFSQNSKTILEQLKTTSLQTESLLHIRAKWIKRNFSIHIRKCLAECAICVQMYSNIATVITIHQGRLCIVVLIRNMNLIYLVSANETINFVVLRIWISVQLKICESDFSDE
jgi:hypothetical protein